MFNRGADEKVRELEEVKRQYRLAIKNLLNGNGDEADVERLKKRLRELLAKKEKENTEFRKTK